MANRRKKSPKQTPIEKYHVHDEARVRCAVCLANAVSRSARLLYVDHVKIRQKYFELGKSGQLDRIFATSETSVNELISSLNVHLETLSIGMLDNKYDFTSYALTARVAIEKLALLNFILNDSKRQSMLSEMYKRSTFDISVLANPPDKENEILEAWQNDNSWTSSNIVSRIEALGVDDAKKVYAYTSRIAHAVNRDASMRFTYDIYHIKVYILITVSKIYNAAYLKMFDPKDITNLSLRQLHEKMSVELDEIWNDLEINPRDSLKLTTFIHYYDRKGGKTGEFIAKYKKDIMADGRNELIKPVEYVDGFK